MVFSDAQEALSLIEPQWPAPKNVKAFVSTRLGGVSVAPFSSLNLGDHVADNPEHVAINRTLFANNCGITPEHIAWLTQVHGTDVLQADLSSCKSQAQVDAATTSQRDVGCVVMTADCMPVLFCDAAGQRVAAAHAGWRGMANGVLESTLAEFDTPSDVLAYMGPTISQAHFEVGTEVRDAFVAKDERLADAFVQSAKAAALDNGPKYMCDLYFIARRLLANAGVKQVYGGDFCTFAQDDLFYSYRRDGAASGRLASMIYLDK